MIQKAILVCAASVLLVTPGQARIKKPGLGNVTCGCTCILANGTQKQGTYDPKGTSCTVLERKTCNIEDPVTHLVSSGTLEYCVKKDAVRTRDIAPVDSRPRQPKALPPGTVVAPAR
jgi:hypothetical protein